MKPVMWQSLSRCCCEYKPQSDGVPSVGLWGVTVAGDVQHLKMPGKQDELYVVRWLPG